nr:MAG TPA: hypothetical protein [Caudoviricetes sp.]
MNTHTGAGNLQGALEWGKWGILLAICKLRNIIMNNSG